MTEDAGETLPDELKRAAEKLGHQQARVSPVAGVDGRAIASRHLSALSREFDRLLDELPPPNVYREFFATVRDLDRDVLALCALQGAIRSVAIGEPCREAEIRIGEHISGECWVAGLTHGRGPKIADQIEKRVRKIHSADKARQKSAHTIAARLGYKTNAWSREQYLQAGGWALGVVLATLHDVFAVVTVGDDTFLTLTEGAEAYVAEIIAETIRRNPVWLPKAQEPPKWEGLNKGGTSDKRLSLSLLLLRTKHESTKAAVRSAIRRGTMRPTLDALNSLQSVPWTINKRVLGVVSACYAAGIPVKGLPSADPPIVEKPYDNVWAGMDKDAREARRTNRRTNLAFKGACTLFAEDMQTAELMAEHGRFYTAMNLDFRGRAYGVPSFNFQREDLVRSLFLFADGEPIGAEGLYWLKVHAANCGDFGKISKRPFDERVQWVDAHIAKIRSYAELPLKELGWTKADKPFLFLAACMELCSALATGPKCVSGLPVTFDGSCNGLQHLCAMTRAPEGALVNLTPEAEPQDMYQTVADRVKKRLELDLEKEDVRQLAQICLDNGITRKLVKRNVMTYSYGSEQYGMADQHVEDTMRPLSRQVARGELKEHPFGPDEGLAASRYLAGHIYAAIQEVVFLPAQAMRFLQKLSNAMAAENKPLQWTAPTGLPWINRYHASITKRVRLYLHDTAVKVPLKATLAVGYMEKIDKGKAAQGVAPNFVQGCDAAHLFLTVNAAVAEGIRAIATVHDTFGCLPSRAARFRRLIREEFVRMYREHDVLREVFDQACADLAAPKDNKRKPLEPPTKGTLNIEDVLNAEYAFA